MGMRRLFSLRERLQPRAPAPSAPILEYVHRKERLRPDNRVEPLRCGQVFPAMFEAIAGARRYVHVETYILRDDFVGRDLQAALIERARAGVIVRLLFDSLGSFGLPDAFLAPLRAAGVHIAEFHPVAPWRPRFGFNQRDHMKIVVVDGEIGFTGGINFGAEYAPVEIGGGGWYDMHARIEGPVVADLDLLFARTWWRSAGERLPPPPAPARMPDPPRMLATVIDNFGIRNRSRKRIAYLHAIRAARSRICLMNAYFLPDVGFRMAMRNAARRGVLVQVIVPSVSDVTMVQLASRHLYPGLLRGGVRLYEWPQRMMHAKSGVIDEAWSTIGSYNIDIRSFFHNLEASVVVADRAFGARMQRMFDDELAKSREVTLEECRQLSAYQRVRQWFCYLWQYWL